MTLEDALRATEVLYAFAVLSATAEHMANEREYRMYLPRLGLGLLLLSGVSPAVAALGLFGHNLLLLQRYQGAYNGGADKMSLLIAFCLVVAQVHPELGLGYLAAQLTLSYFVSGWAKITNPEWRSGLALQKVFAFSIYPVAESLRGLKHQGALLFAGAWAVMILELLFPLALLSPAALLPALALTATFHLANACLFGLNRFLWVWIAAYPSVLWLQARLFQGTSTIFP